MQVDHIGYVVKNIKKSLIDFEKLGYIADSHIYEDLKRNVRIIFIKNENTIIELIEPMNEQADVYEYYKKIKCGPYHLCYKVNDIDAKILELKENGYILTKEKEEAIAFDNKNVAFLFKANIGLIELVEK